MNELVQYAQSIIAFLEQDGSRLNVESQRALGELLQNVLQVIQEVPPQGAESLTQPISPAPPLEPGPYPSSNVNAFKYDPRDGTLFVKFHGKESANSGPVYKYSGVPRNVYDVFSKGRVAPKTSGQNRYHRWIRGVTPSLGASLYALIRNGGFPYQRMT